MALDTNQKSYLTSFEPFDENGYKLYNDGLSAIFKWKCVPLLTFMSQDTKGHPLGILASIQLATHEEILRLPDFIFSQARGHDRKGIFVTFVKYHLSRKYENFINSSARLCSELKNVNLNHGFFWTIDTVSITKKNIIMCEQLFTAEGDCLAISYLGIGIVNMKEKKVVSLPDSLISKTKLIKSPHTPKYIEILDVPNDGIVQIRKWNDVGQSNIDIHRHANFGYYISLALQNTYTFSYIIGNGTPSYKELSLVFKKDAVLGDNLQATTWTDSDESIYSRIVKDNRLITFIKTSLFIDRHASKL